MRAPTVRDVRAAGAVSGGDAEKRELQLFSSLTEIPPGDLKRLKVVDYNRARWLFSYGRRKRTVTPKP